MMFQYLTPKGRGRLFPREQVHTEREIAVFECFPQFVQLVGMLPSGKGDEVQIGVSPGVAADSGAVGPNRNTGQMNPQQFPHNLQLLGREINDPFRAAIGVYSHVSPVIVWNKFVASEMNSSMRSRAALAFSPL